MDFKTFEEFQEAIRSHYQTQNYQSALNLATQQIKNFPKHRLVISYWRATMAARVGNHELAISVLQEVLDSGNWYGEALFRHSPSFEALQGLDEFEKLVTQNNLLRESDEFDNYPLLTFRPEGSCQEGGNPCPMLLALHANTSNAQETIPFWQPAAKSGWLVAIPQSSQAMWRGAYVWDDLDITRDEIQKHFTNLVRTYAIDFERIILAGHSMGGEAAIRLILSNAIEARGFISFGPGGPFMDSLTEWNALLDQYSGTELRGYIIFGKEDDSIPQDNIREFVDQLNENDIICELEEIPGAGHDFTPDFNPALQRAIEFILDN